jgi:hypothetical protein
LAAAVWLADAAGLLASVEGLTYDAFLRAQASWSAPAPALLLVECPPDFGRARSDEYSRALRALRELKAAQVVFTAVPDGAPAPFFDQAGADDVVFGRPLQFDPPEPEEARLTDLPAAAAGKPLRFGIVALPPARYGVARQQRAVIAVGAETGPALEAAAARQRLGDLAGLPSADYHVNFRGGPGSLPHVPLEALLAGRLVPELVQGRSVLVGRVGDEVTPGLATPASTAAPMSLLEFQGNALDSLLLGRVIHVPDPLQQLLLLLGATAAAGMLYQWLELRWAVWLALLLLAGGAAAALLLLAYFHYWVPYFDLAAAQALCLFLVLHKKAILSHRSALRVLLELTSALQERHLPASFYQDPEPWALVLAFIRQALDVNRLILLDADPRRRRVHEVAAYGCTLDDIAERRREYRRSPYREAVAAQAAVRIDPADRAFLKAAGPNEEVYLVPLAFAGELLGFAAVTTVPDRPEGRAGFEALLSACAEQIGELLYRRRRLQASLAEDTLLHRLLTFTGEQEGYRSLARTVGLLERRLKRSERLFGDSSVPTISYDLFGRVREANEAMLGYLRQRGLAPYEMTVVDLIATLTGQDLVFGRRSFRQLLHDRRPLALAMPADGGVSYLLRLHPLSGDKDEATDPAPFQLSGVVCELLDRTALAQLNRLKEQMAGRVGVQLRNDLAAVDLSASLLSMPGLSDPEREEMVGVIHGKVQHVVDTLARTAEYFAMDVPGETDRLPVDSYSAFEAALRTLEPQVRSQGVRLEIRKPDLMSYVLASPAHLQRFFEYALTVLLRDARPNSDVRVEIVENSGLVGFSLVGQGFGAMGERLAEYLAQDQPAAAEDVENLRQGVRWVRQWGGTVEAASKLGEGMTVRASFSAFG